MLPPSTKHVIDEPPSITDDDLPMAIIVNNGIAFEPDGEKCDCPDTYKQKQGLRHRYRKAQPLKREEHHDTGIRSASYVRGISHASPFKSYLGSIVTVIFMTSLALCLFIPLHLFITMKVDLISVIIPAVMVLSGILFFTLSTHCHCRVCRTSVFTLRRFMRNKKAHRIPLLGYNFSTALHILFLFWFRCQACGTTQKLIRKN